MKVTGKFHAPAPLSHRKKSWYILHRRLDISQSQGGCFRTGENPISLLRLKPRIFPPVAYTLCQLCCPVSKHSQLVLFIYLCIYLFLLNWNLNSLVSITKVWKVWVSNPSGARYFASFHTGPKGSPNLHHNVYRFSLPEGKVVMVWR